MTSSIAVNKSVRVPGVLLLLLVLLVVAAGGYHWYQGMTVREKYPPPGRLFPVNGHAMHLYCLGVGTPVVILEAGLNAGSTSWSAVQEALSRTTRVCAYDRPGLDWSEPQSQGFSASGVADNLYALLRAADVRDPLILVGMSAGGLYVRRFRERHPERVVGMVLVDSSHEQQAARLPQVTGKDTIRDLLQACVRIAPLELVQPSGVYQDLLEHRKMSQPQLERTLALLNRNHTCTSVLAEMTHFEQDLRKAEPPAGLGDLPLVVVSRAPGRDPQLLTPGYPLETALEIESVWDGLQQELAALSSRGRRVIAMGSGHLIQEDRPEIVIREIEALVREVRSRPL